MSKIPFDMNPWAMLEKINKYDTWLSDKLCELNDHQTEQQYITYKECRKKLDEVLRE
jgi:hypothetical protein